jgi:nitrite reductase (NADH) small subunit
MSLEANAGAADTSCQFGTQPIRVGRVEFIPRGEGRCFVAGSQRVAVFRQRDDAFFALDARCPHSGGPLADGLIGGGVVVCPLHGQRFRLADGGGVDNDLRVNVYHVEVRDGWIILAGIERC